MILIRIIKFCLENQYLRYTHDQMDEICTGLIDDLDVSRYADPSMSVDEMQRIRVALIEEVEKAS